MSHIWRRAIFFLGQHLHKHTLVKAPHATATTLRTAWKPFGALSEPIESHSDPPRCLLCACAERARSDAPRRARGGGCDYFLPFTM